MNRILQLLIGFLLIAGMSFAEEHRYTVPIGDSPQKGLENAPVTIIEFIDFQ
jgi:hypothetical protein